MLEMDMDIIMTNTAYMPHVRFPHLAHTQWLDCSNCHPKIFVPEKGANPVHMNAIFRGEFCGRCHDKVSFSLFICERCHSVVHEGSGPKWW
jgi:c(7)-type cytochrome triheme protein